MAALILAAEPLPRVLVMIAEQNVGQPNAKYWWTQGGFTMDFEVAENTLGRMLSDRGFTVVDRRVLAGKVTATNAIQNADPSDAAVKEFALQTGAEIVIIGKAVAVDAGTVLGTAMHSAQGTISARVVSLDDARIISSGSVTQAFAHVDGTVAGNKALDKAAKKLGDEMLPKLVDAWSSRVQTISCSVKQVGTFDELKQIKAALAAKLGQSATVAQRSYKHGSAELEIRFPGTGQTFADAVNGMDIGKKRLEVDGVTPATVTLKLAK